MSVVLAGTVKLSPGDMVANGYLRMRSPAEKSIGRPVASVIPAARSRLVTRVPWMGLVSITTRRRRSPVLLMPEAVARRLTGLNWLAAKNCLVLGAMSRSRWARVMRLGFSALSVSRVTSEPPGAAVTSKRRRRA